MLLIKMTDALLRPFLAHSIPLSCPLCPATCVAMSKLSERDVCSKFIIPALMSTGWNLQTQIREEVSFTMGCIIVRGKLHSRGKRKRADYVLCHSPTN